jgi:hypothetical protein
MPRYGSPIYQGRETIEFTRPIELTASRYEGFPARKAAGFAVTFRQHPFCNLLDGITALEWGCRPA